MTVTANGTTLGTIGAGKIGLNPKSFRFNAGSVKGIYDIVVKVNGDNAVSGSSPVLHSIDIGYQVREGLASVN